MQEFESGPQMSSHPSHGSGQAKLLSFPPTTAQCCAVNLRALLERWYQRPVIFGVFQQEQMFAATPLANFTTALIDPFGVSSRIEHFGFDGGTFHWDGAQHALQRG